MENILKNIKLNGIAKEEGLLNILDIEKATKLIKTIREVGYIGAKKGLPINLKNFLTKLVKFDFRTMAASIYFLQLAKKLELAKISEKILGSNVKLYYIDCYRSKKSDQQYLDWHVDQSVSEMLPMNPETRAIRFNFYLTDTSSDNGCLGYIPKSNLISHALKKGMFEKVLKHTPHKALVDFRKVIQIKENYQYIKNIIGEEAIKEFLKNTDFADKQNFIENRFDHAVKRGGALIFDELGVHSAQKMSLGERIIFRYFYVKSKIH